MHGAGVVFKMLVSLSNCPESPTYVGWEPWLNNRFTRILPLHNDGSGCLYLYHPVLRMASLLSLNQFVFKYWNLKHSKTELQMLAPLTCIPY